MALRPLYMRLHFYLPQGTASLTHVGAVAHARYMVSPKKEELVRSSDPGIHARYMAERPGSLDRTPNRSRTCRRWSTSFSTIRARSGASLSL